MSEPPRSLDRLWARICAAVDGFRLVHDGWPDRVALPEDDLRRLREELFREESLARLEEKLRLVVHDDDAVEARDAGDRSYRVTEAEAPAEPPTIDAEEWLGVRPDGPGTGG